MYKFLDKIFDYSVVAFISIAIFGCIYIVYQDYTAKKDMQKFCYNKCGAYKAIGVADEYNNIVCVCGKLEAPYWEVR